MSSVFRCQGKQVTNKVKSHEIMSLRVCVTSIDDSHTQREMMNSIVRYPMTLGAAYSQLIAVKYSQMAYLASGLIAIYKNAIRDLTELPAELS